MAVMNIKQQEIEILHELDALDYLETQESIDCNKINSKIDLKRKLINILHFNIRSIRKNFNELLIFIEAFNLYFTDIIVLSECWRVDDGLFNIEGYNTFYNHADHNQNDGVIVFVKKDLDIDFKKIKLIESGVTLGRITLVNNGINYGITCVYRTSSTNISLFLSRS